MDIEAVAFVFAEPETAWIEDIIYKVIDELPPDLFGEKTSWELVITQYPFIQEFSVAKAMDKIYKVRSKKLVSEEPFFPKDNLESENNFKQFIERRPIRIMLIGDSDPTILELGELLAKKFGTYQVTPKKLLERSILLQTRTGNWLCRNIKEKQQIPIWVVMKLLELELKRGKYTHKGFLLTGFPMIPEPESVSNISSTLGDDENDWFKSEDYGTQEDTEEISSCSSSKLVDFNVSIHDDIFKDILNKKFVCIDGNDKAILNQCVVKYLNVIKNSSYRPEYLIFIQNNSFTKSFSAIIDAVEDFILSYSKENVIQIDGRIGLKYMFKSICNRFKYINYKINYECLNINFDETNAMSLKEMCNIDKPLSNCRWWVSEFGRICPVSLFNGRRRICGNSFTVRYLRYMFFCYSAKERLTFTLNPGKYLNLLPTCRVAVIGPHRSGKSTLSQYFAQYFKADIYRQHIDKARVFINKINMKDFMDKNVKNELKELNALRIHEYEVYKKRKTEEWTTCVLSVANDIFTKALSKGKKAPALNMFSTKHALTCFEWLYNLPLSDTNIKTLILQNSIFNKSMQIIDHKEFLSWVSTKPQTHHTYRQYILDSAPLDIYFWEALSLNDEMPDCVFFLHTWSMEKMLDLYSLSHDETCVDVKLIFKKICESFSEWKGRFELNFQHPKNPAKIRIDDSTRKYIKHLISYRYKENVDFMDKYVELQSFFKQHNVKCINIDISQKSITQSILQAIVSYLSVYQAQPSALYDYFLQNPNYSDINENEESSLSSNSSHEIRDMENSSESNLLCIPSMSTYGNYLDWCPIILERHNVLLKGKMHFAAEYKNKHYLMHSRDALIEFMSKASYFSLKKPIPPPPRIFFAGLCHVNKINFTENLANCLNVKHISYIQNLAKLNQNVYINHDFSMQTLKDSYQRNREEIIQDLDVVFKRGMVILGFPLFLEQFNDAVSNNLFPEYIFIFNDHEEVLHSMYNNLARLHVRNSFLGSRKVLFDAHSGSITSEIESLPESVKQDIQKTCKLILQSFLEELEKIENACSKLNIKTIKMQNNYKKPGIVKHYVEHINQNRDRIAFFENVQQISMNNSKVLLNHGYYRYSRFKRSCPVDVRRLITINHFEGSRTQKCIYPCTYSDFIYFLNGKRNLESFKRNPLEFINTCNPPQMQEPMRIAVFGPPKSGVTTICRALSQKFGCKIFSQKDIPTKSITESAIIDFLLMNNSITPNGLILDNFPLTPKLLVDTARHTVHFCAVFIIISSFENNLGNCLRHNQKLKNCPSLLLAEFCRKFCESVKIIRSFRKSTEISLFNIHYLDGDANSWITLKKVNDELIKTARCRIGYGVKLRKARCATLGYLALFYDTAIFNRKIHHFYCQVCLSIGKLNAFKYYYVNVGKEFYGDECQKLLNTPFGYMNDEIYEKFNFKQPFYVNELYEPLATQKKFAMSLNQFRDVFYWVCYDHSIEFLTCTQQYHKDCDKLKPLYIPFLVVGYTKDFVAFQGYCPVEYERHKFVKGLMNLSVYYRKKVYLLSSKENALIFLSYPEKYRKLKFDPNLCTTKDIKSFHGLSEKTLSVQLLELINVRPKHFKLNGKQSATTFLALKLKTCCSNGIINDYWKTAFRSFVADCQKLDEELKKYEENINPYILHYP